MKNGLVLAIVILGILPGALGVRAQQATVPSALADSTAAALSASDPANSQAHDYVRSFYVPAQPASPSLVAANFAPLPAASFFVPAPRSTSLAAPAAPAAPQPSLVYGSRDDYRFLLGLGYTYIRFRGAPLVADLHGVDTSVVWYANEWLGIEGEITAAFGINGSAGRFKYLTYGGGLHLAWRHRHLEPWMHALVGGAYVQPQLAGLSKAGFAYKGGVGVDWRVLERLSWRFEGDWVRTLLYSQTQNDLQFVTGVVYHF